MRAHILRYMREHMSENPLAECVRLDAFLTCQRRENMPTQNFGKLQGLHARRSCSMFIPRQGLLCGFVVTLRIAKDWPVITSQAPNDILSGRKNKIRIKGGDFPIRRALFGFQRVLRPMNRQRKACCGSPQSSGDPLIASTEYFRRPHPA